MSEEIEIGDQSRNFNGCLKSLPVSLSEMPDTTVLRSFSNNSQRDVYFDKHVVR